MAILPHGLFEVVDSILLLCNSQNSDHCLWILLSHNNDITDNAVGGFVLVDFKIRVSGLGSYFIDGARFLQNLIQSFTSFQKLFSGGGGPSLESVPPSLIVVICRRIGDSANVSTFEKSSDCSFDQLITESVIPTPYDFTGFTLELKRVRFDSEAVIKSVFCSLRQHLFLSHLINPQMTIYLNTSILIAKDLAITLDPLPWQRIVPTSFKLASTMDPFIDENYRSLSKLKKMKLFHSTPIILPNCKLTDGFSASIKLSSYIGIFPYLKVAKGKKIPADRVCNKLQVSFYGPGNIVLLPLASKPCFDVKHLVSWSDYRLTIVDMNENNCDSSLPNSPFEFTLSSCAKTDKLKQRTLKIFIFIEEVTSEDQRILYRRSLYQRWSRYVELTSVLRSNFHQFLPAVNKKVQRALRSALNKLICNYGSFKEVNSTVNLAIPVLSDAVATIVTSSSHKSFQQECLGILDAGSLEEVDSIIRTKLQSLANKRLGVTSTDLSEDFKCPEEPSTPELEQANGNSETISKDSTTDEEGSENIYCSVEPAADLESTGTGSYSRIGFMSSLHSARVSSSNEQVVPTVTESLLNTEDGNITKDADLDHSLSGLDHFESLLEYEQIELGSSGLCSMTGSSGSSSSDGMKDRADVGMDSNTTLDKSPAGDYQELGDSAWNELDELNIAGPTAESDDDFNSLSQSLLTDALDGSTDLIKSVNCNGTQDLYINSITNEYSPSATLDCFDQLENITIGATPHHRVPEYSSDHVMFPNNGHCYTDDDFMWD